MVEVKWSSGALWRLALGVYHFLGKTSNKETHKLQELSKAHSIVSKLATDIQNPLPQDLFVQKSHHLLCSVLSV